LGLQNQPYLQGHHWQAQLSFQYADTNQFYIGDQRNDAAGPFGEPPHRRVTIIDLDVLYGVTNRINVDLTVPYLSGSGGVQQGTDQSHQFTKYTANGLGDISLQVEYWLSNPEKPGRISGSVSLGFKAPTGSDSVTGLNYNFDPPRRQPIDEAFQLGNGGWELLLRAEGTAQIIGPLFAYGSGYYGLSLTEHTDVIQGGAFRGVPDTYSARLGGAYLLPLLQGIVVSAGGRINGVTVRDFIGGGDLYFRRPGYEIYFEPGLTWTLGRNMASVSVPLRVYQKKLDSLLDVSLNRHIGADFAPFLVVASYARRF
jgi:hypothetical protein